MTTINHKSGSAASVLKHDWRAAGYSVSELVFVISIMGVLSGITVGAFHQFLDGSKDALATARLEMLNQALHSFAQYNKELIYTRQDGAAEDERTVLRVLQYRGPSEDKAAIGSPYLDPMYNPLTSSSDSSYRLRWTGRMYELLKPQTPGTGLLMNFEGTDFKGPPRPVDPADMLGF
jgi:type II secretory pathway pseudopilin PulG